MSRKPIRPAKRGWRASLTVLGPGLAVAATGVGAGDLVAASVSGARYGFAVAWAAVIGAVLKFAVNEGLARWQLATGTTLLEGWVRYLGRWVQYLFLGYLVIWSFIVAGALISACGLAAHALAPILTVEAWGIVHSLAAATLVLLGGYRPFEKLIGLFIGLMFVTLIGSAFLVAPPSESLAATIREASLPPGSVKYILGVIGGVGGSVTLLSYGYWIREKGWEGAGRIGTVRADLAIAYGLVGLFGLAVMILAAHVLHGSGTEVAGAAGVLRMAGMLENVAGVFGKWIFIVGCWGAMATSMLGVWQGVPYLFSDFVGMMQRLDRDAQRRAVDVRSPWYRGFLLYLCVPPMVLLMFQKPVGLIVLYSVLSALFMPFLAGTLLFMNSRRSLVGTALRSGWILNGLLLLCLALFAYLGLDKILGALGVP
jgi:Mn2+/Fe2+ NRAMP family transporter